MANAQGYQYDHCIAQYPPVIPLTTTMSMIVQTLDMPWSVSTNPWVKVDKAQTLPMPYNDRH